LCGGRGSCADSLKSGSSLRDWHSPPRPCRPSRRTRHPPPTPAPPATLDDLTRLALEQHPRLAQAAFAVEAARGRAIQAGLYPNPTFQFTADELGDRTGPPGILSPFVNQEIVRKDKLRLGRAAGERAVDQAALAAAAQRYALLAAVRQAYVDVLTLKARVDMLAAAVKQSHQAAAAVQKLIDAKQASRLDLLLIETDGARRQADLDAAAAELPAAARRLAAAVGVPEAQLGRLTGSLDPPLPVYDLDRTRAYVLATHPEVQAARVGVDRSRLLLQKAHADAKPNITLSAGYTRQSQNRSNDWGVGVLFPLPVWNKNQGAIKEATANLGDAAQEVKRVEADLADRVAVAVRDYAAAVRRAERYRSDVLPRAREAFDLSVKAYQVGQYDYAKVVQAQRDVAQTNLDYIAVLGEAWRAAAILSGLTLEDVWPPPPVPRPVDAK
jgi:cobalt-zinc-cadmium efflux system outer membrane protein